MKKVFAACIMFIGIVMCSVVTSVAYANDTNTIISKSTEELINTAIMYFKQGSYDKAINEFDKAIEVNRNDTNACFECYFGQGLAYLHKGDYERAVFCFNKTLEAKPSTTELYYLGGVTYLNPQDYNNRISELTNVIGEKKTALDLLKAYYSRGLAYLRQNEFDKAISDFNKADEAIEKKPTSLATTQLQVAVYNSLAWAYLNKGDSDNAISCMNKAIAIEPNYSYSYFMRALIYFSKKDYEKGWSDVYKSSLFKRDKKFLDDLKG